MASLDFEISTEEAVTVFAILSGLGGAASQILAGKNLSRYPNGRIPIGYVLPAVAVSVLASAGAAWMLIPDDEGFPLAVALDKASGPVNA